jgi:hypothetical protein
MPSRTARAVRGATRRGEVSFTPTQLALLALRIKCAIACAIVGTRLAGQTAVDGYFQAKGKNSQGVNQIGLLCGRILERSGAGVEPTQRGAATPHRF